MIRYLPLNGNPWPRVTLPRRVLGQFWPVMGFSNCNSLPCYYSRGVVGLNYFRGKTAPWVEVGVNHPRLRVYWGSVSSRSDLLSSLRRVTKHSFWFARFQITQLYLATKPVQSLILFSLHRDWVCWNWWPEVDMIVPGFIEIFFIYRSYWQFFIEAVYRSW